MRTRDGTVVYPGDLVLTTYGMGLVLSVEEVGCVALVTLAWSGHSKVEIVLTVHRVIFPARWTEADVGPREAT